MRHILKGDFMTQKEFEKRLKLLKDNYNSYITRKNTADTSHYNGIYERYVNPVLTCDSIPLEWRYDLNYATNPNLLERIGVNAVFNSGAVYYNGKFILAARVEGADRKSYFAVCESDNGIDNFKFRSRPVSIPIYGEAETNVYDMRLTVHSDGWIYGLFCSERHDDNSSDISAAVACCGIVRTKDFENWERLPDLKSKYQQRNVVLHPEFVGGKYMFYTRPSDGFTDVGSGGGIGAAFTDDIANAKITDEKIIDGRRYHTVKESKNGAGAPPIKTEEGWLHIAHGVRNTAAGLRYVLYCFVTELDNPQKVKYAPGGYFMAPKGGERVGDVSNVLFCNGAAVKDGDIYIYYASSDTRLHVAVTSVEKMLDYCKNTPPDGLTTHASVAAINALIDRNLK